LNFEDNPAYVLEIEATDDGAGALRGDGIVTVELSDVNEAPIVTGFDVYVSGGAPLGLSLGSVDGTDPEDDVISFEITSGNTDDIFSVDASTGELTVSDPLPLNPATTPYYELTISASDGALNGSSTVDIYIVGNSYPSLVTNTFEIEENSIVGSTVATLTSDDPDGIIEYLIISGNDDNQFILNDVTGKLTIFDNSSLDAELNMQYRLSVSLTDGGLGNLSIQREVTINIIDLNEFAPSLAAIGGKELNELETLTFNAEASDDDVSAVLTYSLDATSISNGITIDVNTGIFSWIPTESQDGSFSATITVSDGDMDVSETIAITVNEVNAAPLLTASSDKSVEEEETLNFIVTATDADLPANSLTYSLDAAAIVNGMTINATSGLFSWTPTEPQEGSFSATVTVTDGDLEDTETITITVNEVNEAPVLTSLSNQSIAEGELLTFTATASDVDLPANTFTYSLDAAAIANGMTINATSGLFTWTPTESQDGSFSATVTVTDGDLSDAETITISVNEVNEAPVLTSLSNQSIAEGKLLTFTATASDVDIPAKALTYSLDATAIANGMTINATLGVFTWTPTESQEGNFSATVSVTDGDLSDAETITITVNEVNEAPVLTALSDQVTKEGELLTFTATVSDVDLPANAMTYSLDATAIANGMSINANTGLFSWTPTESQDGSFSATVSVTDGDLSDAETVLITVNEVNVAPVLTALSDQVTTEGELLTFTATATDADLPANTLSYGLDATSIANGMIINSNSGVYSWTPTKEQVGDYNITVIVSDGLLQDAIIMTITVDAILGIRKISNLSVKVYPNPTARYLIVEAEQLRAISLLDINGRWIKDFAVADQIDVSDLNSGIYLLQVKDIHDKVGTIRFVKND
jgi:hypothetical protein